MPTSAYEKAVKRMHDDPQNFIRVGFTGKHRAAAMTIQTINKFGSFLPKYVRTDLLTFTKKPRCGILYCLPKTHKSKDKWVDGLPPSRPICPDIGTESSCSGRFIAEYLKPYVLKIPSYLEN